MQNTITCIINFISLYIFPTELVQWTFIDFFSDCIIHRTLLNTFSISFPTHRIGSNRLGGNILSMIFYLSTTRTVFTQAQWTTEINKGET